MDHHLFRPTNHSMNRPKSVHDSDSGSPPPPVVSGLGKHRQLCWSSKVPNMASSQIPEQNVDFDVKISKLNGEFSSKPCLMTPQNNPKEPHYLHVIGTWRRLDCSVIGHNNWLLNWSLGTPNNFDLATNHWTTSANSHFAATFQDGFVPTTSPDGSQPFQFLA